MEKGELQQPKNFLKPAEQRRSRVLVAEDEPVARHILKRYLEEWGYEVQIAKDGAEALQLLKGEAPPHLLLIDWWMPGINGLELSKLVKGREDFFYVIMITKSETLDDEVLAFESGVDDFLTKPFDKRQLKARVEAANRIISYELELQVERKYWQMHADQMELLARERATQLVHADRLATLGTMSAGVAHEINNPTSFISGNVQTLETFWPEISAALQNSFESGTGNSTKQRFIIEEVPKLIEGMKAGVQRITRIVQGLKRYSKQEQGARQPTDIVDLIKRTLQMTQGKLKERVAVELSCSEGLPPIAIDSVQIEQVLINLIVNAADAMEEAGKAVLKLGVQRTERNMEISVEDSGPGIPSEVLDKIWNPFFTTKEVDKGTGLGLHICKDIILAHGGTIRAENKPQGGACFTIELPI